jgi:hypothetical protein
MKKVLVTVFYSPPLVNFRGPLIIAMQKRGHSIHVCSRGLSIVVTTPRWLEA